ncbi:fructose-1,6-bisphosphate aldolase/phosphatase [Cuniculiplasma divulgatum]|jgi:fructose 1,6-bisphosphate aldolase/phosphatase|uniref:Fructose-1,6-bisphosphate aldolase/phosphatase n=1 Tax=Cuniculiplasma divulgatum TaxID=1673428 RepID=A0A1N5VHB4_9ARCH|nr:fructose-1,6-bisphosphate aldolase/phosphatase [Cuniculiplasma divulgatum]MCI2411997.1 fructose-1,6-bisphosphatase [Cuniculiplasma sp.]MCL4320053.1 fructose-1,6-bisphosphatase [Candidatus Thermoplasmatota archaeon]WMT49525.1 MAG: fructose-1,6-bisphosphate aldolase/phosphatase [Thermoplasmatales archaeon]MCL6015463.1 fructose-1,6-bisphosphatase [Candidatus Thermoplasmatota archaeon]SIM72542.1 bifunctional fructose-1,6-bisphosphate aldolase/phosphatase [Cuniculiplasma divulgatum]
MKVTLTHIKADIGSLPGHTTVHEDVLNEVKRFLKEQSKGIIWDHFVGYVGDDIQITMVHDNGVNASEVHKLAWDAFKSGTEVAKKLGLYGAGQDLLKDSFSGNIKGMGPGIAEMDITPRRSEPFIVYMMDKTEPGAFNYPIFKMFADPFNTPGLVIDQSMHDGFKFEVWDIQEAKAIMLNAPEEMYDIISLIGTKGRYVIKRVYTKKEHGKLPDENVAVITTDKLSFIAGEYVGKDDPAAIVRIQSGLPASGEAMEAFSHPYLVSGWMRGSFNGPLMPVAMKNSKMTRFDGPPRVVALGFVYKDKKLTGPVDMFDDPAYDNARKLANDITDYIRRMGPFEPHRLPEEDMEYTTLPKVMEKLKGRFVHVDAVEKGVSKNSTGRDSD